MQWGLEDFVYCSRAGRYVPLMCAPRQPVVDSGFFIPAHFPRKLREIPSSNAMFLPGHIIPSHASTAHPSVDPNLCIPARSSQKLREIESSNAMFLPGHIIPSHASTAHPSLDPNLCIPARSPQQHCKIQSSNAVVVPGKVNPSHANTTPLICSHDHCDKLYGGCEHCPYCSTTPPLPHPVEFATQAAVVAESDPFLQRLNKSLQDTIARVHRQNGGADERDLKNDYAVQRQLARVFAYKQRIGLEPAASPENTLEIILRIPTRIQVFRVRNKGYYCHAIALLCGPPVQPCMVSVLEEVSTGALFSSGRMLDVKFRVACPYLLARKRVLGLLGKAMDIQNWELMDAVDGEVDVGGLHWSKCMDAQLTSLVLERARSLPSSVDNLELSNKTLEEDYAEPSLIFEREYIESADKKKWWKPTVARNSDNTKVTEFVSIKEKEPYNENQKNLYAATEAGKQRMYQEKQSELATDHNDGGALLHQWDNREFVTRENVNFTRFVEFKGGQPDDCKDDFIGNNASNFMIQRIKPRLKKMRDTDEIRYGVATRTLGLTSMNLAIEFLRRKYLKHADMRNVEFVHMAYTDITPAHWKASGLMWRLISGAPENQRRIVDGTTKNALQVLKTITKTTFALPGNALDGLRTPLQNDHYFVDDGDGVWIQIVDQDKASADFDGSQAPAGNPDQDRTSLQNPSLFEEACEITADLHAARDMEALDAFREVLNGDEVGNLKIQIFRESKRLTEVAKFVVLKNDPPSSYFAMQDIVINYILQQMCQARGFDFAHETLDKIASTTLVLPVDFFKDQKLDTRENLQHAHKELKRRISDYTTLVIPGRRDDTLFLAYVTLKQESKISAFAVSSGRELRDVREDLRHFINACLREEYGNDHGNIRVLRGEEQQRFYREDNEWRCQRDQQELLLLAWVAYFFDGRVFDFEPSDEDDMDEFRAYFAYMLGVPPE